MADVPLEGTQLAAFSADGRTLATVESEVLGLWSTTTGRLLRSALIPGGASDASFYSDLRFTPDGRYVITGTSDVASVVRWTVADPLATKRVALPQQVGDHDWAVSPDGRTIADIGLTGVEFRAFDTGRVEVEVPSTASAIEIVGFTGRGDGVVVWDGSRLQLVDRSGDVLQLGPTTTPPPASVLADDPDLAAAGAGVVTSVTSGKDVLVTFSITRLRDAERAVCRIAGRDLTRAEWDRYIPGIPYRTVCKASGGTAG